MEELKVLQTIILLVTTTDVVKHHLLAKVRAQIDLATNVALCVVFSTVYGMCF